MVIDGIISPDWKWFLSEINGIFQWFLKSLLLQKEGFMAEVAEAASGVEGGKFLTFLLQEEEYGLEILKVREIMGLMDITTVPQTPSYVRGVINLRGQVIPVVDLD